MIFLSYLYFYLFRLFYLFYWMNLAFNSSKFYLIVCKFMKIFSPYSLIFFLRYSLSLLFPPSCSSHLLMKDGSIFKVAFLYSLSNLFALFEDLFLDSNKGYLLKLTGKVVKVCIFFYFSKRSSSYYSISFSYSFFILSSDLIVFTTLLF